MANAKQKTISVKEAADRIGLSRAIVSRLCQRGIVGTRVEFPEFRQHVYRLTEADVQTLKERKKEWSEKVSKKRRNAG